MDYLKWWAGVCSWPPPLRWCPQPPPRGTALPSAARRPPLNGWLHPQTYWHENGFRWPDTRSDKDGHARQNSLSGGTLHYQNRLHLQQHQCAILPYTPGWCRSVGQREEGPMIHWWRCCFDSLLSTLSLAGVVLQVLVGGGEKTLRHNLRLRSNFFFFFKKNVFVIMECLPQFYSLYSCSKQENKGRSMPSAADGGCSTPSQYHIFMVVCITGKCCVQKKTNKKKIQPTPTFLNYRLICLAFSATHFMQNRFNLCFSNCTNNTHPPERIREGVGFLLPRKYRWVQ